MPVFPELPEGFTFESSIFQILTSIAMEEIGLSHIINAEGEKLQYILGTLPGVPPPSPPPTMDQVLEVNDSIQEVLRSISFSHMFLNAKMADALKAYLNYLCMQQNGVTGAGISMVSARGRGGMAYNAGRQR